MLPVPDVVLHERILLCESTLDLQDTAGNSTAEATGTCDVLRIAARKAVGCEDHSAYEADPALILSPDCKSLAVKEPRSRRVCLLSANDGFKEPRTTFVPLPVARDNEISEDTILSCSWSSDSQLLLVACQSSAVYLIDSAGGLVTHWDPSSPWAQLQLVSACHGPANTVLLLTAARVLYVVGYTSSSSAGSRRGDATAGQQQQQLLEKHSVKSCHSSVKAISYDDKAGLVLIAGDGNNSSSSNSSKTRDAEADLSSSSRQQRHATAADAFAAESVTFSAWQLKDKQLKLKFKLGKAQGGPGFLASSVAGLMGIDLAAAAAAAAAARWSLALSPLLEYVALLTGAGSVYIILLSEGTVVDPAVEFAGRNTGSSNTGSSNPRSSSSTDSGGNLISPSGGVLGPQHVKLNPASAAAAGSSISGSSSSSSWGLGIRSVCWWGPRVLAVSGADGSVALARLPGSVNVLGAAPAKFTSGSRVVANHSGDCGLLVVEPITTSAAAAAPATGLEAAFAANPAAAGVSLSVLGSSSSRGGHIRSSLDQQQLSSPAAAAAAGVDGSSDLAPRGFAGWLAGKLGVIDDAAAAAAAAGSSGVLGCVIGWRLVLLAERTPQQLVQVHLRCHDWGSAFYLSREYSLDADVVYRARWSASHVSRATISDNLPKMKDRRAVMDEVLTRLAPDYESARLLISYGLKETMKWAAPPAAAAAAANTAASAAAEFATPGRPTRSNAFAAASSSKDGSAPSPGGLTGLGVPAAAAAAADLSSMPASAAAKLAWWRLQRLKLLQLLDRLEESVAINNKIYDPTIFQALRHEDPLRAAAAFAAAGNVAGLQLLLQRHRAALHPKLLLLLSQLPETVDPRMYAALIPRAGVNNSAAAAGDTPIAAAAGGSAQIGSLVAAALRAVGPGNVHYAGSRKVDWVESVETLQFLAAAAAGQFPCSTGAAAAAASAEGTGDYVASPRSPAAAAVNGPRDLSRSSSLDASIYHIHPDDAAAMLHATEEMERLWIQQQQQQQRSIQLAPSDQEIAEWMAARALQIDSISGQLQLSVSLLEVAVSKGYGNLSGNLSVNLVSSSENFTMNSEGSSSSSSESEGHGSSSDRWEGPSGTEDGLGLQRQQQQGLHQPSSSSSRVITLKALLIQAQVLSLLISNWWPAQQQQQQQHAPDPINSATSVHDSSQPSTSTATSAAAAAAAAAMSDIWSVGLVRWVSAGCLVQLLTCLANTSRDVLQQDLMERVIPLLSCCSHSDRTAALQHLLRYWITAPAAAAGSTSGSSSSSSTGMSLAVALVEREAGLLQAAAASSSLRGAVAAIARSTREEGDRSAGVSPQLTPKISDGRRQQQQQQQEVAEGGLIWAGDVSAYVTAVLAAVRNCSSTNQWAKLEQILDAAAAGLAAAAAAAGSSSKHQHDLQPVSRLSETGSSRDRLRAATPTNSTAAAAAAAAAGSSNGWDAWSDHSSSEEDWESEVNDIAAGHTAASSSRHRQQQQQQAAAALQALQQHGLTDQQQQQLQQQLDILRGCVRAARLLTKQGVPVSVGELAAADAAAVRDMVKRILGRAQRLGTTWPEGQWAQVWHDLLEAQQSGLTDRLPADDLASEVLRALLLTQQYQLAVQFLPRQQGSNPLGGTPKAAAVVDGNAGGAFAFHLQQQQQQQYDHDALHQQLVAADAAAAEEAVAAAAAGLLPQQQQQRVHTLSSAEAALAALTGSSSSSRFGVRKALHTAAGAAVGRSARLMGVGAGVIGSTAHLVGSTAQAVSSTGGLVGTTAGLVSGTASFVSSAATLAAAAAAKAGGAAAGSSVILRGAQGVLSAAAAEGVVVGVSRELLASAGAVDDLAIREAEDVLALLPEACEAAAAQRSTVAVLRRLPEFGVSLLPAQLTALPDKRQLIHSVMLCRTRQAIPARPLNHHQQQQQQQQLGGGGAISGSVLRVAPWRRLGDVLELASLLGMGSHDDQQEVRLLAAEAAYDDGEVDIAQHLLLGLAAARYAPAWRLAAEMTCPDRYSAQRAARRAHAKQLQQQQQQIEQQLLLHNKQQQEQFQEGRVAQQHISSDDGGPVPLAAAAADSAAVTPTAAAAGPGTPALSTPRRSQTAAAAAAVDSSSILASTDSDTGHHLNGDKGEHDDAGANTAAAAAAEVAAGPTVHDQDSLVPPDTPRAAPVAPLAPHQEQQQPASPAATVSSSQDPASPVFELSPRVKQQLLSFAACHSAVSDLPALTDELLFVQQQQQQQQRLKPNPTGLDPADPTGPATPLLGQAADLSQQQQQQLQLAVAAAAAAGTAMTGLPTLGDAHLLLALLLQQDPDQQQQIVEGIMNTVHIVSGSSSSSMYSTLQRVLVTSAAARLLLPLQQQSPAALQAAGLTVLDSSSSSIDAAKHQQQQQQQQQLPLKQQLLQQLLSSRVDDLQRIISSIAQQQQQQDTGEASAQGPAAAAAAAAAASFLARLQQLCDGRQLKQWLPHVDTARFLGGDKVYQEDVLIQLASKAGQLAVQPAAAAAADQTDESANAALLMHEAEQLAAAYGADSWQLVSWFVHSVIVYAADINDKVTQDLIQRYIPLLLERPAAAAVHLYSSTYPLLPAAAANHIAYVLGVIRTCLQRAVDESSTAAAAAAAAAGDNGPGSAAGNIAEAAANTPPPPAAAAAAAVKQPLDYLKQLLTKSSAALAGLAVKQIIAGQVDLMLGPAIAAAAASSSSTAAAPGSSSSSAVEIDVCMTTLEAIGAIAAYVSSPVQADRASKFLKHIQNVSDMIAKISAKPQQQQLAKLAAAVSPGLPHLLLLVRTMSSSSSSGGDHQHQQQQQQGQPADHPGSLTAAAAAAAGGGSPGRLTSYGSADSLDSYGSCISRSSSLSNMSAAAVAAAPQPASWAIARAKYCSTSGRQQLLRCNALQLEAVARWLVLQGQQPLPEDAVGVLQPITLGPGLSLQILDDVITLILNPGAQLAGLDGARPVSSGSSTSSSASARTHSGLNSAAAAGSSGDLSSPAGAAEAGSTGGTILTVLLLQDDLAAVAAYRPPVLPDSLAPRRRDLVQPLIRLAVQIAARQRTANAVALAGLNGASGAASVSAAVAAEIAAAGSSAEAAAAAQQALPSLQQLLRLLLASGHCSAVEALQLVLDLLSLQQVLACSSSAATGEAARRQQQQQSQTAVAAALEHLTRSLLSDLQVLLTSEAAAAADNRSSATAADKVLKRFHKLINCLARVDLPQQQPALLPAAAAAEGMEEWYATAVHSLRCQFWNAVQQYQQQLPAEAYSSSVVAGLLEQQELINLGQAWPGWLAAAAAAAAAAGVPDRRQVTAVEGSEGASAADLGTAGDQQQHQQQQQQQRVNVLPGGSGLLLARTLTAISKHFPGIKATAEDVSSVQAAITFFSRVLQQQQQHASAAALSCDQTAALQTLLRDVWKDGQVFPQSTVPPPAAAAGQAASVELAAQPSVAAAADSSTVQQQQDEEEQDQFEDVQPADDLALSVGLPPGSCTVTSLHPCWYQLLAVMLAHGQVQQVVKLLDRLAVAAVNTAIAATTSNQAQQQQLVLLIDESEASQLLDQGGREVGPAGWVVLGLLMPYATLQERSVQQIERGEVLVAAGDRWMQQLLALLLLRGQLNRLNGTAVYRRSSSSSSGSTSASGVQGSGQQLHQVWKLLLDSTAAGSDSQQQADVESDVVLDTLLPHVVAQLCLGEDYASAAALVASKTRLSAGMSTLQGAVLMLERYLAAMMRRPQRQTLQGAQQSRDGAAPGVAALGLPCCEEWLVKNTAAAAHTAHSKLVRALSYEASV